MQPSRVAIAAVFIVVGALILLPTIMKPSSSSRAASGTPSPSVSVSASASRSPRSSASPGHHRRSPAHSPSPSATRRTTPAPSVTPPAPLKATIGGVRCPGRSVRVTVTNTGARAEDYTIVSDGDIAVADRIPAGATRRSTVNVREDRTTTIEVDWHNVPVKSLDRRANCVHGGPGRSLPHTGPDRALVFARVATGVAAMLTGAIIFWYGRLWPRRRDRMFDKAS